MGVARQVDGLHALVHPLAQLIDVVLAAMNLATSYWLLADRLSYTVTTSMVFRPTR